MQSSSGAVERVRPAVRGDIPRVWELVRELADYERLTHTVTGDADDLARYAFDDRVIEIFVIEDTGRIVGYTITFASFSTFRVRPGLWLEDLYVTPAYRGRGYGRALLQNVMAVSEERGCARLEWSVLDWNASAIALYEKIGATVLPDWRICRVSMPRSSRPA